MARARAGGGHEGADGAGGASVEAVGFGRPATVALARRIQRLKEGGHPLDPVTVVVPSHRAGVLLRRLLGSGAFPEVGAVNLASVAWETPFSLAERLGADHSGERLPLTDAILGAAVRAVLAEEPRCLKAVAQHEATEAALASAYSELSRTSSETRDRIAEASDRGRDVVALVEAIDRRLQPFIAERDLAQQALDALRSGGGAALGPVIWFLPEPIAPTLVPVLAAAVKENEGAVLVADSDQADGLVGRMLTEVGLAPPEVVSDAAVPDVRLVSVSDPDDEVRHVVRGILAAAEAGVPLDRIAVYRPTTTTYARTLAEHLDGAGIPHHGPAFGQLSETAAGRVLLAALDVRATWSRSAVTDFLAAGPLRFEGRAVPLARWERISRRAGIVQGIESWRSHLEAFASSGERAAEELAESDDSWRARKHENDVRDARHLARFVDWLAGQIAVLEDAASWAERGRAARDLLHELLGPHSMRQWWAQSELTAVTQVEDALVRLSALDSVDDSATFDAFVRALRAELGGPAPSGGISGSGVLVAPLSAAPGLDFEAAFVVGLVEGVCPTFRRDGALLPESDRLLAVEGELDTPERRLQRQHRCFRAAVASSRRPAVVTAPRGELRSRRELVPSRWIVEIARAQTGADVKASTMAERGFDEVIESFTAGLVNSETVADLAERDLAAATAVFAAGGDVLAAISSPGRAGLEALVARSGSQFTQWDGNLEGHQIPSPATGQVMSPTRLEVYAGCQHRYFLQHVLGLSADPDPQEAHEISAMDKGNLFHSIAEQFISEAISRPAGPPEPDQAWTERDRARILQIAREKFAEFEQTGNVGRPLVWQLAQLNLEADLLGFLKADSVQRAKKGSTPASVEMAFGLDGADPLVVNLAKGRTLAFRGKADRVDTTATGVIAWDYKTGSDAKYTGLESDGVIEGKALQLPVYARAAAQRFGVDEAAAYYWMTSAKRGFKVLGYPIDSDIETRFQQVAQTIVDGIEGGVFPVNPGEYKPFFGNHEGCRYCDFNSLCSRQRSEQREAKSSAPQLSVLAGLLKEQVDELDGDDSRPR